MIEIPRAALTSDLIAPYADFYSFGTNDLTQMTFGFSRDDVGNLLPERYIEKKILKDDPFQVLDTTKVLASSWKWDCEGPHGVKPHSKQESAASTEEILIHRLLLPRGPELRILFSLPCSHSAARRCPGGDQGQRQSKVHPG